MQSILPHISFGTSKNRLRCFCVLIPRGCVKKIAENLVVNVYVEVPSWIMEAQKCDIVLVGSYYQCSALQFNEERKGGKFLRL